MAVGGVNMIMLGHSTSRSLVWGKKNLLYMRTESRPQSEFEGLKCRSCTCGPGINAEGGLRCCSLNTEP